MTRRCTLHAGIFARIFGGTTLVQTLDAVAAAGIPSVQFDLECAGLPGLPQVVPADVAAGVRAALTQRGINMAAVSGTYNMIDPDPLRRADHLARLRVLIAACPSLGARTITLCSGTRDRDSMWHPHPDNGTPEAWHDLVAALAALLPDAEAHGVNLAVEPEVSNVIDSAQRARRLLDELASPRLKICIDGANLFHAGELPRMAEILDEAFTLLGGDIVLAHAKDLARDGAAGDLPAGHGRLDYTRYLRLLHDCGYHGAVVLHSLSLAQLPGCLAFLRRKIAQTGGPAAGA